MNWENVDDSDDWSDDDEVDVIGNEENSDVEEVVSQNSLQISFGASNTLQMLIEDKLFEFLPEDQRKGKCSKCSTIVAVHGSHNLTMHLVS